MASIQLSSMWQARLLQKYGLSSRVQQRPWRANACRSVTCKVSKSSGPVRYAPRSTNQPQNPSTPVQTKSHQETNKHVPPLPSLARRLQDPRLADSPHLSCNLIKQNGETHPGSGFSLDEENGLPIASANAPHMHESIANSVGDSKRSHANTTKVSETYIHVQDVPMKSLASSPQSYPLSEQFDSSQFSGKYQEKACTSSGFLFQEERDKDRMCDRMHAGEWRDKAQTKGKNPFAFVESKAETKTRPQAIKSILSLPILGKHPVNREFEFQEGKRLPCKDVESFLLKVQKANRRDQESLSKSHTAASAEGSLCIGENYSEREDSDDDTCLFLEQGTLDEKEDGNVVNYGESISKSMAAQEHAKNQAIRYLAMRPYTAHQLRKKLESQNITSELADYALTTVQKCGLQSDLVYAETFSRARFTHASWGPQRIKLGLKQRGISNEVIQAAIASVFCEEENNPEQIGWSENDTKSNSAKMSRAAMDHLLVQATKKWNRGRNATNETKTRRMVSWLQYRGFNYDVIKMVLRHLQQEIHTEDE